MLSLHVDNWTEVTVEDEADEVKIKDAFKGMCMIKEEEGETYLGDLISEDGRNIKNMIRQNDYFCLIRS